MLPLFVDMAALGFVDGFSDISGLPEDVAKALANLREHAPTVRGTFARPRRTFMAIPVDPRDDLQLNCFESFAPYSIHAELVYDDGEPLLILHDTSTSIEIIVSPERIADIEAALPSEAVLRRAG